MKIHRTLIHLANAGALAATIVLVNCDDEPEGFPEVSMDNFWEVVAPSAQQMDETALDEVGSLVSGLDGVYSFLIVRNGKIVHEQYHNGAKQNSLLHIRSVTKRITATLTGILIDQSLVDSVRTDISNYFPEIRDDSETGQGWEDVNVYHLLNMVSGMDWDEESELSEYERRMSDPLKFIFGKDITHEPGTYYSYNTPGTHLLSYIIDRISGRRVVDYAKENLFDPLGIRGFEWQADGKGVKRGGAGLEMTTRDLAKVGLLYLQNGEWQGEQIVSGEWIDECFTNVIELDDIEGEHLPGIAIGQTWWRRDIHGVRIHYGDGYGGQVLLLIPEHEIVIVMNRNYKVEPGKNYAAFQEFFDEILPGVIRSIDH